MQNSPERQRFLNEIDGIAAYIMTMELFPDVSFFMKGKCGKFMVLNKLACEFCGVASEAEGIGKCDRDFFPLPRAKVYEADDQKVFETGKALLNLVEPSPEKEPLAHLILTSKIPLFDREQKVVGLAGVSRRVKGERYPAATIERLGAVMEKMHRAFGDGMSVKELADLAGLSVRQFERVFQKALGMSPVQYLMRIRLDHASQLILESAQTISEIAHACGFYDHAHFGHAFTQFFGVSPGEYRKRRSSVGRADWLIGSGMATPPPAP